MAKDCLTNSVAKVYFARVVSPVDRDDQYMLEYWRKKEDVEKTATILQQ